MQLAAMLGLPDGFKMIDTLAGSQTLQNLFFFGPQLGGDNNGDGAPNRLLWGKAKNALCSGAPAGDEPAEILGYNGIVRGFDDGGQTEPRLIGLFLFADVAIGLQNGNNISLWVAHQHPTAVNCDLRSVGSSMQKLAGPAAIAV